MCRWFPVFVSLLAAALVGCGQSSQAGPQSAPAAEFAPGISYTNENLPRGPWSIHVVRARRETGEFRFVSVHARRGALGLSTLSQQVRSIPAAAGTPMAAVNGDFYERDRAYAGDPRGLQIIDGEMISAPVGGVGFWLDAAGQPHATNIESAIRVSWSAEGSLAVGFNENREPNEAVLYSPTAGTATRTSGGREWVLVPSGTNSTAAARIGMKAAFTVKAVRDGGNSPIEPGQWVLSVGQGVLSKNPSLAPVPVGATISIHLATLPDLSGATQAISGGPLLVSGGKALKIVPPRSDSYQFSSMLQRHPRSAMGWSRTHLVLVQVDGRQPDLSVGMTLEELGATMVRWGCEEAMNLDGGGSATFWCDGEVRNSPCDGGERPIANSLVLVRKPAARP
jgi:hypothetical protein